MKKDVQVLMKARNSITEALSCMVALEDYVNSSQSKKMKKLHDDISNRGRDLKNENQLGDPDA